MQRRTGVARAFALVLVCGTLIGMGGAGGMGGARVAAAAGFADPAIAAIWQTDEAKLPGFWGPIAGATEGMPEPYAESPNGQRQAQYFAGGRITVNAKGEVSYGDLVTEMLTGAIRTGDTDYDMRPVPEIAIAPGTDLTFAALARNGQTLRDRTTRHGGFIIVAVAADGTPTDNGGHAGISLSPPLGGYDTASGHNLLAAFAAYRAQFGRDAIGDAITEPFLATFTHGNGDTRQIVQLFARRVLILDGDSGPFGVESAATGQTYYQWRYGADGPHTTVPFPTANDLLATYYDAVNGQDYQRAYALWTQPAQSYADFAAGYAATRHVQLLTGVAQPGADATEARLPVYLFVANADGDAYYRGCYRLSVGQADATAPRHYAILGADLAPAFGVDSINDPRILQSLALRCG